jgi:hypothetical protein
MLSIILTILNRADNIKDISYIAAIYKVDYIVARWGMFGRRVKTGHSDTSRGCDRTSFTLLSLPVGSHHLP